MGILTQFAAATAQKGTNLPINGGMTETNRFNPSAVTSAPVVAQTYEVASCLFGNEMEQTVC